MALESYDRTVDHAKEIDIGSDNIPDHTRKINIESPVLLRLGCAHRQEERSRTLPRFLVHPLSAAPLLDIDISTRLFDHPGHL
jgi:hypothetical protein